MIASVGLKYGFSRDEMSYANYGDLKNYFIEGRDIFSGLKESISKGKTFYKEIFKNHTSIFDKI